MSRSIEAVGILFLAFNSRISHRNGRAGLVRALVAEEKHENERQYDTLDQTEDKDGLRRELHTSVSIIPKPATGVQ
jgi:hypothetical protein